MTKVRFEIKSHKENATIYARFQNGRNVAGQPPKSFIKKTRLFIRDPQFWDAKKGCVSNSIYATDKDALNAKLAKLYSFILDTYIEDVNNGVLIDNHWFANVLLKQSGQIANKKDAEFIYWKDFGVKWEEENDIAIAENRPERMQGSLLRTTFRAINVVNEFDEYRGSKAKTKFLDFNFEWLKEFLKFMDDIKNYNYKTQNVYLGRVKYLLRYAEAKKKIIVNEDYKSDWFVIKKDKDLDESILPKVYFDEDKLDTLYDARFEQKGLESTRIWLIIMSWTAMRNSDARRLPIEKLEEVDFTFVTKKTKTIVTIPVSPYIKEIMDRFDNNIPKPLSNSQFNKNAKKVCRLLGFNDKVDGSVYKLVENPITKEMQTRKTNEIKQYFFWELVTSHIGRRTLATNLTDKFDIDLIMEIGGWTKAETLKFYNQKKRQATSDKLAEWMKSEFTARRKAS